MLKVGIITINDPINYGNRLQNYAMQSFLESLGYYVETIPNKKYEDKYYRRKNVKKTVMNKIYVIYYYMWRVYKFFRHEKIQDEKTERRKALLEERAKNFQNFNASYIKSHHYVIKREYVPRKVREKYDYFVVGSDQIWNPNYKFGKHTTYLQFAPPQKRIAIAPSFGVEQIPEKHRELIARYLKGMQYISVRETSGQKIVNELIGQECDIIIDPTLLVPQSEWDDLVNDCNANLPEKYVLTYFLGDLSPERKIYIEKYAKKNNLPIININNVEESEVFVWGPDIFLKAIKHCCYFFTDSFHGCVFSILFHKQFSVFQRMDNQENMFGRIETLLSLFGLMKCKVNGYMKLHEDISEKEFEKADEIINKKRKETEIIIKRIIK